MICISTVAADQHHDNKVVLETDYLSFVVKALGVEDNQGYYHKQPLSRLSKMSRVLVGTGDHVQNKNFEVKITIDILMDLNKSSNFTIISISKMTYCNLR